MRILDNNIFVNKNQFINHIKWDAITTSQTRSPVPRKWSLRSPSPTTRFWLVNVPLRSTSPKWTNICSPTKLQLKMLRLKFIWVSRKPISQTLLNRFSNNRSSPIPLPFRPVLGPFLWRAEIVWPSQKLAVGKLVVICCQAWLRFWKTVIITIIYFLKQ